MDKLRKVDYKKIQLAIVIVYAVSLVSVIISVLFGFSDVLENFFPKSATGYFTDLFAPYKSIYSYTGSASEIYDNPGAIYPVFVRFFLKLIGGALPREYAQGAYTVSTMRDTSYGLTFAVIYEIIFSSIVLYCVKKIIKSENFFESAFALCLMWSTPYLFLLERGNVLIITIAFLGIFIAWYDSESPIRREIALMSLALAAAMKIYPAVFGVLLLREKKIKESIRCAIYFMLSFIVPMLIMGGITLIKKYINNVFFFASAGGDVLEYKPGRIDGLNLLKYIADNWFGHLNWGNLAFKRLYIPLLVILVIASLFYKKKWKAVLVGALVSVTFPTYVIIYSGTFYMFAFAMFFVDKKKNLMDILYAIGFMLILVPSQALIPLFNINPDMSFYFVSFGEFVLVGLLAIDALVMFIEFIIKLKKRGFSLKSPSNKTKGDSNSPVNKASEVV